MAKLACFAEFTESEFKLFCKVLKINPAELIKYAKAINFKSINLSAREINLFVSALKRMESNNSLQLIVDKLNKALSGSGEITGGSAQEAVISAEGYFGNTYAHILSLLQEEVTTTEQKKKSSERKIHDVEDENAPEHGMQDEMDLDFDVDADVSAGKGNKR